MSGEQGFDFMRDVWFAGMDRVHRLSQEREQRKRRKAERREAAPWYRQRKGR